MLLRVDNVKFKVKPTKAKIGKHSLVAISLFEYLKKEG